MIRNIELRNEEIIIWFTDDKGAITLDSEQLTLDVHGYSLSDADTSVEWVTMNVLIQFAFKGLQSGTPAQDVHKTLTEYLKPYTQS